MSLALWMCSVLAEAAGWGGARRCLKGQSSAGTDVIFGSTRPPQRLCTAYDEVHDTVASFSTCYQVLSSAEMHEEDNLMSFMAAIPSKMEFFWGVGVWGGSTDEMCEGND